tara:strand:- start:5499 stop:5945 length:447 start_codon:yes stop_codon:yes gene_type:complete
MSKIAKCKLPKNHKDYYYGDEEGRQIYPNLFNHLLSVPRVAIPKEPRIYKVGGLPCTKGNKGNIDGLSHEEYRAREKSYYQKFKRICDKNNLGFEVNDYDHPQGEVHFDKDIGLCCFVTGEPHGDYTIFEDWEGMYLTVKEYFEGESK